MTLVYRSVFTDPDGRIGSATPALFEQWLSTKGLSLPLGGLSKTGAPLTSTTGAIAWAAAAAVPVSEQLTVSRLRLVEEAEDARWVTTVAWASRRPPAADQASRWIWVDLEHEPAGGRPLTRPGSPRLVREMLAAGEAHDALVPLTAEAWRAATVGHVNELTRLIKTPDRQIPVIVFAYDGQHAYDQDRLARNLARDLAGVAVVFQLSDASATDRLSQSLPEGYAVYGGAMRTYLPGATIDDDDPARHRVLGRASLVALGTRAFPAVKDQILEFSTKRAAPVAGRARSGASSNARVEITEARAAQGMLPVGAGWLRSRIARIARALERNVDVPQGARVDELAEQFDSTLELLLAARAGSLGSPPATDGAEVKALLEQINAQHDEREVLEQLLEEADRETSQRVEALRAREQELDDLQVEATASAAAADHGARRIRYLERQLRGVGKSGEAAGDEVAPAPTSVAEVIALARQTLEFVEIGDTDSRAAELDLHGLAQLYAVKTWSALVALNAYAQARVEGSYNNSFYAWCQTPPSGESAISATTVALMESETVETNPTLHDARVFDVPASVSPAGRVYMPAHVKIVKRGAPCPRLHFHDDSGRTGKVYVGYVGEHLPTGRFS